MNKRETLLHLLSSTGPQTYIPAGFFIHFDEQFHRGQAAVQKHLEYYNYTGMDFVKIQYEHSFPHLPQIQRPSDWARMPLYRKDYYQNELGIVDGIVKAVKKEALVIMTLYSPFMCAGSTSSRQMLLSHIKEDPEAVKKGMEIITESLMIFVKECIKLGIDGFYASTQGGETHRLGGSPLFAECVKPYDLALMDEMNQHCPFNILHVCDFHGSYDDLTPFFDYPGHLVNCNPHVGAETLTPTQLSHLFGRPFMGGLDRKGTIAGTDHAAIAPVVRDVLQHKSDKFFLGADCTLPHDVAWQNIRTAIELAHSFQN